MIGVLEDDSTTGSPRALIDLPGPQNLVVVDWAASSAKGRKRLENEDNWRHLGPIFALSDAMGGMSDGAAASALAVDVVAHQWLASESMSPLDAVHQANDRVRSEDVDGEERGCTLTALRIAHDQATIVHVGDSRAYRVRDGVAELLTRDHNLRSELLSAGIIPAHAGEYGPLTALTSHLGKSKQDLEIDLRSVSLRRGDRLVLSTDGVFGEMSHSEFVDFVIGESPSKTVAQLHALGSKDDATMIIVDIDTDGA